MRKPATPSKPAPRWLLPALLALTALLLLGLFSTEIAATDFWWHLKTGQYIVTRHRLPTPDPFAYTTASAPPVSPGVAAVRELAGLATYRCGRWRSAAGPCVMPWSKKYCIMKRPVTSALASSMAL